MFYQGISGLTAGTASPVTGDDTAALLHFDGDNGSTTFTDETSKQTWTCTGTINLSTAQKKFGTASLLHDAADDNYIFSSNAVNCGTGDFTLEFFFYVSATGNIEFIFTTPTIYDCYLFYRASDTRFEFKTNNSSSYVYGASTQPTIDTWHHLAIVKYSGVGTIYLNGNSLAASRSGTLTTPNVILYVACNRSKSAAYLDEFRASSIARYTGNFTPPTSAFTVD